MRIRLSILIFVLVFTPPLLSGQIDGSCGIEFYTGTVLTDFSGEVTAQPFSVELKENPESDALLKISSIKVAVSDIRTGIKKRDKDMREMFKAEKYPLIEGTVRKPVNITEFMEKMEKEGVNTLPIFLRIRNVENKIDAKVTKIESQEDKTLINIEFPVLLSDFEIERPSFLWIKVHDKVRVELRIVLQKSAKRFLE